MVDFFKRTAFLRLLLTMVLVFCFTTTAPASDKNKRRVKDFRGVYVDLPQNIDRVITISDGMIAGIMTVFKIEKKIVALGSQCIPRVWSYTYPTMTDLTYEYQDGMNPVTFLNPWLADLPIVAESGTSINYEKIATLAPDLVIMRKGSCSLNAGNDLTIRGVKLIEALGIPVVVLYGPNACDKTDITSMTREIEILGKVFEKEPQAANLAGFLENTINLIKKRTRDIPESQKKEILMMGLSPKARSKGGAAHIKGNDTIQTIFIKEFVNGRNAFDRPGAWSIVNTEQILAIDPDVIVLVTSWGYHPPKELYEAPYYQNLKSLKAVKNRQVAALPWTPCNCEKRLEFPIDIMVMAKITYPELFKDIDLAQWVISFYQNLYGVDKITAEKLRSCQWMDWTKEK